MVDNSYRIITAERLGLPYVKRGDWIGAVDLERLCDRVDTASAVYDELHLVSAGTHVTNSRFFFCGLRTGEYRARTDGVASGIEFPLVAELVESVGTESGINELGSCIVKTYFGDNETGFWKRIYFEGTELKSVTGASSMGDIYKPYFFSSPLVVFS